jgi:RNA polymerase sigma-19 factor, ECF subfamily
VRLYDTYSDARLAVLLTRGDERAFTAIYERYWEKLFAIAYHYCKDKAIAEEVLQEIFVRLWDKRGAVNIEDLGAYLATSVKFSVFKSLVRTRRRQELIAEHLAPVTVADDEPAIAARFLEEYINGVVESLPEQCRVVYLLRRREGLSVEEIARQLDISPHTARNHINKALKTLRLSLRNLRLVLAALT